MEAATFPCVANLFLPVIDTIPSPNVAMKIDDLDSEKKYTYGYCNTWTFKGDLKAAKPWGIIPVTNSVGLNCTERARSYCDASATFDVERCSVINVNGSFASGAPLVETVKFNCIATGTGTLTITDPNNDTISVTDEVGGGIVNDVGGGVVTDVGVGGADPTDVGVGGVDPTDVGVGGVDPTDVGVGVVDPAGSGDLAAQISSNLIYILPGVLAFLLVAGVAICCIIKRRRRQSAENEVHALVSVDQLVSEDQSVDYFVINLPWRQQPTSEKGTSDKEPEKQRKKAKDEFKKVSTLLQGTPPRQPTSKEVTSDKEPEKQRKKEKKKKAKDEFKKVSALVQGTPPRPPILKKGTSDKVAEKQSKKGKNKKKK